MSPPRTQEILRIEGLKKHFPIHKGILGRTIGFVYAVDGVSFAIHQGETLGLVGESGCGKSTVGRCLIGLYAPTEGRVFFEGRDLSGMSRAEMIRLRTQMQMIFQDPYSSLNPGCASGRSSERLCGFTIWPNPGMA